MLVHKLKMGKPFCYFWPETENTEPALAYLSIVKQYNGAV